MMLSNKLLKLKELVKLSDLGHYALTCSRKTNRMSFKILQVLLSYFH